MKIGLLSTINNPMIGLYLESFEKDFNIDCVILDPKKESKKDLLIWEERTHNKLPKKSLYSLNTLIPSFFISSHSSKEMYNIINSRDISLLINCGTPRILNEDLINFLKIGILNCHPGILPNYRGYSCVEWALYNGDEVGNTCHLMTNAIDEGPIICINKIDVKSFNDYESIRLAVYLDSIKCISQAIKILISGNYNTKDYPQNGTYYKPIDSKKMKVIVDKYSR